MTFSRVGLCSLSIARYGGYLKSAFGLHLLRVFRSAALFAGTTFKRILNAQFCINGVRLQLLCVPQDFGFNAPGFRHTGLG